MKPQTIHRIAVCFVALAAAAAPAAAAGRSPSYPRPEGEYYAFLYLGGADPNESTQILEHESARFSGGAGVGWRFHRLLAFEMDASVVSAEYDLPGGIGRPDLGDDKLELSTAGLFGNVKLGPRLGRLRPHVGVGLGLGYVDVSVTNSGYWLPTPLKTEISLLSQVMAGMDVRLTRRSYLGVQFRELFAHHGMTFAGEEVDGGGQGFAMVYRWAWGGSIERRGNSTPIIGAPPPVAAE